MRGPGRGVSLVLAGLLGCGASLATAQVTSSIHGVVRDAQGAVLPGVTVVARQGSSGLERTTVTDASGVFSIPNLPTGTYALATSLDGFAPATQRVDLATVTPADVTVTLAVAGITDTVVVVPEAPVVDATSAGTRHAVSMTRLERMPVAVSSRGIEAVLVAFPGFAQNANGAIHPRGAHNQMTYVVDGLPISDQLTGAFANALDVGVVQTAEVMTGNIPAEFGGKVSGVAVLNSRSGLGVGRAFSGSASATRGGFGTVQGAVQGGGERGRVGYFGSVTTLRTDRFLDQVSLDNLHNAGAFVRGFGRADLRVTDRDTLRLHVMGGRSRFELANLRSQQAAGQDQRQALGDLSSWATFGRSIDTATTVETTLGYRTTSARLDGSPRDTPVSATQDRRLATLTLNTRVTRQRGRVLTRAGVDLQRFPVREHFTMGVTSAAFNAPGSTGYNAALAPFDLTRGGAPFVFAEARAGVQVGGFAQSSLHVGAASITIGLRHDEYHFLVSGRQLQPRIGASYRIAGHDLVVRASYNRTYQTPPNENLLLSSADAAAQLAPPGVREALGGTRQPIRPERQDVAELGLQAALGRRVTFDLAAYQKWSRDQQDNNNFFDTGIIFPTTLRRLEARGAELRLTLRPISAVSASVSATTARAIATPPFTGGLFLGQDAVDLLAVGPFAIDHDQRLGVHAHVGVDPTGPWWMAATVRHDSGLVANPSDPVEVAADRDYADLLPYVDLAAQVPRVRPRTVVDVATGVELANAQGRRTWGLHVQFANLMNRTALYNFQSVFVGTRVVQPRTASVRVSRFF